MEQYKRLSRSLISAVLVSVILVVTTSIGLITSPILAADSCTRAGMGDDVWWFK